MSAVSDLLRGYALQEVASTLPEGSDPVVALLSRSVLRDKAARTRSMNNAGLSQIERQLRKGFLDAGRQDLARMVGRPAFDRWIQQESGWRPGAVSPANNQGLRNGGLFQFWYGHDFSNPWEGLDQFTMPVRRQARMAATQFDLTPADIRGYARQIRAGTYKGWG